MASSSSSSSATIPSSSAFSPKKELTCIHCKSKSTTFITGWPLGDGSVAQLCHRCGSLYEKGSFCETFHKNTEGWLECAICKKRLHCGCLVSKAEVHFTFFGKLCCKDCAKKMIRG
ncbi:hypothetical protein VNO80_27181 [Phaseolus coccineus]|uniref:VAL1-3 N-terminal zinc finger domain-containing protein n=1 Tax=Phaseolus coccineus TaxID=3886 RepID=A0AAN9LJL5_PHACN